MGRSNETNTEVVVRCHPFLFYPVWGISGGVALCMLIAVLKRVFWDAQYGELVNSLPFIALPLGLGVFLNICLLRYKITLTANSLTYRNFFWKNRTIQFEDILKTNRKVINRHTFLEKHYLVWSRKNPKKPFIDVNTHHLGGTNYQSLIDFLESHIERRKRHQDQS